jgi:3-hydroxyisobutyrate dehydrogenase
MVADDRASREVWLGKAGALGTASSGAVMVECSTLSLGWVRELGAAAGERGCGFLDAPVTGTKPHAASGELLFLVGGDAATLESARPVLQAMSRKIINIGPPGSGALLKLINNYLCGVQAASLAEGLALIERSGLNREGALDVLTNGAPGSPLIKALSARMTARTYDVNFKLDLMLKDLEYAGKEASDRAIDFDTGRAAERLFRQAQQRGWGPQDFSSVVEGLR